MKKIWLLAFSLLTLSLAWCGVYHQDYDHQEETSPSLVKIGVIAPLSGPATSYGKDAVQVYTTSVEEFNANHTWVKVELVIEDGKCSAKDATSAVQKLIDIDKVNFLLWGVCSQEFLAASKIAQSKKLVNLSSNASAPEIANIGDYIFRFYNDLDDVRRIHSYLQDHKKQKIWFIYENSDYTTNYYESLKQLYTWEIVFAEKFSPDEKDFELLIKGKEKYLKDIDVLFLLPQTDSNLIALLKAIEKLELLPLVKEKMVTTPIAWSEHTFATVPDLVEGMVSSALPHYTLFGKKAIGFIESLKADYKLNSNEFFATFFKESIDLLLRGIVAGNLDSQSMKKYFQSFNAEHPIQGYFGDYYFSGTNIVGLKMNIEKVIDGKLEVIE